MPTTTRTLNPLPFLDLEPHRFEDLARQLAYEFRTWRRLEATGRGGADDGIDILGEEVPPPAEPPDTEEDEDTGDGTGRIWLFQCKREKQFGPAKATTAVAEALKSLGSPPHGLVLVVACDVSKAARDAFRTAARSAGVEEFYVWARGELEDLLFQPRNDRLLFAYFDISLTQRRASLKAKIRSTVATKRTLKQLFKADDDHDDDEKRAIVLQAADSFGTPDEERPILVRRCAPQLHERGLIVLDGEFYAFLGDDGESWDSIDSFNIEADNAEVSVARAANPFATTEGRGDQEREYWRMHVPVRNRAFRTVYRLVPFDRIVAVDPIGHYERPVPHVYVDWSSETGPYSGTQNLGTVGRADGHRRGGDHSTNAENETRIEVFPNPLPADPFTASWLVRGETESSYELDARAESGLASILTVDTPRPAVEHGGSPNAQAHVGAEVSVRRLPRSFLDAAAAIARRVEQEEHRARVMVWTEGEGAHQQEVGSIEFWLDRGVGFKGRRFVSDSVLTVRAGNDGAAYVSEGTSHRETPVGVLDETGWATMLVEAMKRAFRS